MAASRYDSSSKVVPENDEEEMSLEDEGDLNEASSDESLDSDDGSDPVANERVTELWTQLTSNPYLYDTHVELINLLRKEGDLEELRRARQNMHKYYPLTEALWLEWIEDEVKLEGPRPDIDALFKLSTKDYQSVAIWLEYVQYSIGGMADDGGMERCRAVFEAALSTVGLHVTKGANIWEAYRELESAILAGMQPDSGARRSRDDEDGINQQMERVNNLFKRQLAVPLFDMEATFAEFVDWADDDGKSMTQTYQKTLQKLEKLKPFEQKLMSVTPAPFEAYLEYLSYEMKEGEPARIQCLFERAIKDHCLQAEIWTKYLTYLDDELKIKSLIIPVYERAIRNCPWSVDVWLRYMRAMERHEYEHNDIKGLFEMALNAGFAQGGDYLLLWTGYCDYLRRRINWAVEHEKELEVFRLSIERGIAHLYQMYGNDGDPTCTLQQYWARVEARYCKNMTKCREIWNEIMTRGHGNEAKMWLEFLTVEWSYGDAKHCRKVMQRAVNSVTDWPEVVCEAYINFEREEGSLMDYDLAVSKCKSQLERIEQRQQAQRLKEELKPSYAKGKMDKKNKAPFKPRGLVESGRTTKVEENKSTMIGKKRKPPPTSDELDNGPAHKAQRLDAPLAADGAHQFKQPAIPGRRLPVMAADNGTALKGAPQEIKSLDDDVKSECTVFVSNLSYDVTEQHVRETFEKCGEIKDVRLVVDKVTAKFRGFGYVEFANSVGVAAALCLDRTMVQKRPMYVSVYKAKSQKAQFKYDTSLEKNKLFIKNLPFTCSKDALTVIFSQHGELRDVRLVTHKSGAPKGLAYVEFVREEDAALAVLKTDGLLLGEHTIEVALSNPPSRRAPHRDQEAEFTPTLGGGKKETGRSKAHTMVALIPRALHKPGPVGPSSGHPGPAEGRSGQTATSTITATTMDGTTSGVDSSTRAATMKSNADFRNLLLKK